MVMHRAALIVLHTEIAPDDFARNDSLDYFRSQGFANPLRMARTLAPFRRADETQWGAETSAPDGAERKPSLEFHSGSHRR